MRASRIDKRDSLDSAAAAEEEPCSLGRERWG